VPPPPPKLSAQEQLNGKFALARTVEQSAELERAAAAYKDVLKSDRKHAASHHRLAVVCERQGKSDEAEEHFRLALRQSPNDAELLCDFGYSLYLRGQFAEAESHLRGALKRVPTLARAHNNLGLVLARTGRVAESIPHFETAGGSSAEAHANAAFALMLDERWPEAHEQLMIALEIDPNCAVAGQRLNEVRSVLARTSPNGPGINDGIHASALGPPPQVAALPPAYSAANAAGGYSTR
jgi:Tfp pilus assembly protein PilF